MAKRSPRRGLGCLVVILLLVLAVAGAGWLSFYRNWTGPGPAKHPTAVVVPPGSSLAAAARELEKQGAVRSTTGFLRFARHFGTPGPIRAGEYEVAPHMSARDILDLLQSGRTVQRLVTVPEGMPAIEVYERLMGEKLLTGRIAAPAEGSVLPGTYSFQRGEPRAAVLKRMQQAMTKALDQLWMTRKADTVVNSKEEAVTLAAIVEKETSVPAERPMVAGVYSNRLRKGMRLQADPTIIYPMTQGKPLGRRIKLSEVRAVNDYNTYAMAGLPKGPITNPSRESIAAVLAPATTDALYFVADGKGGHVFATDLKDHNANVQRYYNLRKAQGAR
ncbi:endolytic transglycosylase MltG [Sphingomonas nostoxanthinifaciens]|uniref:endolytic transglycosylase MltG n=1 Tax=Sphingomonas nostoxanthinifaciens TaxID=2872652 RepID=UPI001CC1D14F|nr:endolytic transglycosylase MltG [Sphingomonas nostoxanthinifaciens]UAK22949.1 endolytic transglycosylase MltG [Sphingomonas nostoxanthinifaciens]